MQQLLYSELVPWYRLVDPAADHRPETDAFLAGFERALRPESETLLELGAGAGHNAVHLKRRFRCTLSDISEGMLALSRELNPECEHVLGDMRSLRLGRTFDAVLVHDAVCYMTSLADLRLAAQTAFVHTRPGGAAIFAPDAIRDTFREQVKTGGESDGARSVKYLEWSWDADPEDDTCEVEYVLVMRDGQDVQVRHDHHVEGLFSRATWVATLAGVGYRVESLDRPIGDDELDQVFLCRRP